jgi:phosphoribosylglycinamide formyltransferase 1
VKKEKKKIAVFASGAGTNAENLVRYFAHSEKATIELILTNNPLAGVVDRAKTSGVPCIVFGKKDFHESDAVLSHLLDKKIDFIVLAGFLLLVPEKIIRAFEKKIINIHPALLPGHGGKGFYGKQVHRSVLDSGSMISGITIHEVNERFDEGEIIFQAACHISKNDTPDLLAAKINQLEYTFFPVVVEKTLNHLQN